MLVSTNTSLRDGQTRFLSLESSKKENLLRFASPMSIVVAHLRTSSRIDETSKLSDGLT